MSITPEPSDNTTLTAILAGYASRGYEGQFTVDDDGVRRAACGTVSEAEAVALDALRRLEGASDPADMAAVLALVCPVCDVKGTLVVMFGPEASAAEARLLQRAQDHRFDDEADPDGAPDPHGATEPG